MSQFKSGYVGLIGRPNAGKSTLLNNVLGEKVSIVSSKPQTTRKRVTGIYTTDKAQFVFVDSPGLFKKQVKGLNQFLLEEAQDIIENSDSLLVCLDGTETEIQKHLDVLEIVAQSKKPWVLFLTKADLTSFENLDSLVQKLRERMDLSEIKIAAVSSEKGLDELKKALEDLVLPQLPDSPGPLFDPELFTQETVRDMAAEIIREKCFLLLKQEIPYGVAVQIRSFDEEDKITKIYADIIIEKESHKRIVIGKEGSTLKKIGTEARKDIQKLLDKKVFLGLHVTIKRDWTQSSNWLKELGYVTRE